MAIGMELMGKGEMYAEFQWETLRETEKFKDLGKMGG